jgi:hypothetical protein
MNDQFLDVKLFFVFLLVGLVAAFTEGCAHVEEEAAANIEVEEELSEDELAPSYAYCACAVNCGFRGMRTETKFIPRSQCIRQELGCTKVEMFCEID